MLEIIYACFSGAIISVHIIAMISVIGIIFCGIGACRKKSCVTVDSKMTSLSLDTEPQKALVLADASLDLQVSGPITLDTTPGEEGNGTELFSWQIPISALYMLNREIQRAEMCSKAKEIEFCERFQCKPAAFLMKIEFQLVNHQFLLQENADWLLNFKKRN